MSKPKSRVPKNDYRIISVPVAEITFAEYQQRIRLNQRGLQRSITEHGIINPPEVMEIAPNKYRLITGLGRLQSARQEGVEIIECILLPTLGEIQLLDRQFAENEHRDSWHPYDLARLVQQYKSAGVKQQEIGRKLGLKQPEVTNLLNLANLPPRIQQRIKTSYKRGDREPLYLVARQPDETSQIQLLRLAVEGATVSALRAASGKMAQTRLSASSAKKSPVLPESQVEEEPSVAASSLPHGAAHLVFVDSVELLQTKWKTLLKTAERVLTPEGLLFARVEGDEMSHFLPAIPKTLFIVTEIFLLLPKEESRFRSRFARYFVLSPDIWAYDNLCINPLTFFTDFSKVGRKDFAVWRSQYFEQEFAKFKAVWKQPTIVDLCGTWDSIVQNARGLKFDYIRVRME